MHYTTGKWSGLPNYSCTHCPFETLDEAEMLTHIIEKHLPQSTEPEPVEMQDIASTQELPVLVVTPEQLSKLQPPRKRGRKEH